MEKVWLKRYPKDVPEFIDPDRYTSLNDIFEEATREFADQPAFINMGRTITYRRLDEQSRAFAAYLQNELNLQKGDRVAVMMPNLLQYPIAIMGILRAGMVVVNVNPLYTPRELEHQLNDSGAKAILILSNFAHTLEKVVKDTLLEHVILTNLGDQLSAPKRTLVNFVVQHIKKMVPKYSLPGAVPMRKVLSIGQHQQYIKPEISGEDLAFLQYTGGTTGVSKGAMLSHRNMVANLEQAGSMVGPLLEKGRELVVTALPLYHIFALTANFLVFFKYGARNLLITNPRDMPGFVKELSKQKITAITGVNTLFNGLLNAPGFEGVDFTGLKMSLGGGMAVQKAVAERWKTTTGCALLEGYGLTECAPMVSVSSYEQHEFSGTIGLPAPSTEIRIADEDGNEQEFGQPGELQVKGPQVMQGYWQRPQATNDVMHNGWFGTGDVATCDEEGNLRIVDRKKDMILVSGFNVFPNEIEDVVAMHDKVLECAAIGVPHDISGEVVKLYVVSKDPSLEKDDLIKHCRKHLTAYKVPKLVEFREELPKTNVGKILRRELRKEHA